MNPYRNINSLEINMALSLRSTPEHVIAAHNAWLDTVLAIFNNALNSAEKLASLNISSARAALEDQISGAKSLLGAKDLQEALSLQGDLVQPQIEKAIAYSRSLHEISSDVQEQLDRHLELHLSEVNKSITAVLDLYSKSSPGHSEFAVTAVKSAISAANTAYGHVSKAARQAATITQASVDAATSSAVRAVAATTPAKKKAA